MKKIRVDNETLLEDAKFTYLSADASASDGTLTVESIVGFSSTSDEPLVIGELGNEATEMDENDSSNAPTGSTVTLTGTLDFAHSQGTKVYIVDWDQVEISHASTEGGSKTVLDTIDLQVDQEETVYTDTTKSSGYYFVRFKNTIDSTYSSYSDPIPWAGWGTNTVGHAIEFALQRNRLDGFTDNITYEFCIDVINDCLKHIHGKRKHWHSLQEFDYDLGTLEQGEPSLSLPTNAWQHSNKSILDLYIEDEDTLSYVDEREFNDLLIDDDAVYTTLSTPLQPGDTTAAVNDVDGYDDSGSLFINGQEIDYSGVDTTNLEFDNIPSTASGSVTSTVSSGYHVWQGYDEGTPMSYTIKEGELWFWPLADSDAAGKDMLADYWKEAPEVDSNGDELDITRYDMVKHYLTASIRWQRKNEGIPDLNDGSYQMFREKLRDALLIEAQSNAQKYKTKPNVNKMNL